MKFRARRKLLGIQPRQAFAQGIRDSRLRVRGRGRLEQVELIATGARALLELESELQVEGEASIREDV